jgi:predicted nucleic acid-binding protein
VTSEGVKIKYLDASALVKLYIEEKGSHHLRDFFYSVTHNFKTTWLCLAESLVVLKNKWRGPQSKKMDTKIETYEYLKAVSFLITEWRDRIETDDIKSVDPSVPLQVRKIAEKYNLDYSDALQLWSFKSGRLSPLAVEAEPNVYESALVLITADKDLASAAESEGIKVWNCEQGPAPEWAY